MSAANVVMAARAAGIQTSASKGDDLLYESASSATVTGRAGTAVAEHKPAIRVVASADAKTAGRRRTGMPSSMSAPASPSSMVGCSRQLADAQAFSCCVSEWLNRNPVSSSPEQCLGCAGDEQPHNRLLPFDVENPGYAWLHPACWSQWLKKRRAQAGAALRNMGIRCRSTPPEFCWQKKRPALMRHLENERH